MPAVDPYPGFKQARQANDYQVYQDGAAVTPSDTVDLTNVSLAIYVGATGNLTVIMAGAGESVAFTAIPAGTLFRIRVTRVMATGTTATGIVALW